MVGRCCRSYLMLQHIDPWMLNNSLINKRSRKLHPIVAQRMRVADSLSRYLAALGLEKRQPPAQDLSAYIVERYSMDGDE